MNFLKRNIKLVITFILGMILAITITAYAVINANQIDYTSNKKVSDALDDLYDKSSELNTLKTNLNQANASASDILSGKKAYVGNSLITGTYTPITTMKGTEWNEGEFTCTVKTHTINLGFKPKKVYMYAFPNNSNEYYEMFYATENISRVIYYYQGGIDQEDASGYFYLTENGFEYVVSSNFMDVGWKINYVATK